MSWALVRGSQQADFDETSVIRLLYKDPVSFFANSDFVHSHVRRSAEGQGFLNAILASLIDQIDLTVFDAYIKPTEQVILKSYVKSRLEYFTHRPMALYELAIELRLAKMEGEQLSKSLFSEFESMELSGDEQTKQYGYLDTKPDAFRHAYLTARFCQILASRTWGLVFMAAHEMDRNNNSGAAIAMDLHNNMIGARAYEQNGFRTLDSADVQKKVAEIPFQYVSNYSHFPDSASEDYTPLEQSQSKQTEYFSAAKQFENFENQLVYIKSGPDLAQVK